MNTYLYECMCAYAWEDLIEAACNFLIQSAMKRRNEHGERDIIEIQIK